MCLHPIAPWFQIASWNFSGYLYNGTFPVSNYSEIAHARVFSNSYFVSNCFICFHSVDVLILFWFSIAFPDIITFVCCRSELAVIIYCQNSISFCRINFSLSLEWIGCSINHFKHFFLDHWPEQIHLLVWNGCWSKEQWITSFLKYFKVTLIPDCLWYDL